jgi:hypothetical protein
MKLAKLCSVIMAAVLCLTAGTALAADKTQVLKQESEKLGAVLNESQIREMGENVALFKKAGLSYQPSLVGTRRRSCWLQRQCATAHSHGPILL